MDLLGNSLRSAIHIEILFRSYPRGWDVLPEGIIVHRASPGSEQDLRAQLDCTRSIASGVHTLALLRQAHLFSWGGGTRMEHSVR